MELPGTPTALEYAWPLGELRESVSLCTYDPPVNEECARHHHWLCTKWEKGQEAGKDFEWTSL